MNKSCISCRARKVKCDAAVVGVPCSSCASRQSTETCRLAIRKGRIRKVKTLAASRDNKQKVPQSDHSLTSNSPDCQDSYDNQAEPDLLYLRILNDALKDNAESRGSLSLPSTLGTRKSAVALQQCSPIMHSLLDDVDNHYLVKKGIYDLPHPQHLNALITTYFDHVHPYIPIINRADFTRQYQAGHCSLFLLYAILTPATLHAATAVLSACGFASRSDAQKLFFTRAKLLHDFATEDNPLLMLQGSMVLCMVVTGHPTDRDFGYWFHNAARIATKLDIASTCIREDQSSKTVRLYRRIWWTLHSFDIFHVFTNTKRTQLLQHNPKIRPGHEDDWEADASAFKSSDLVTAVTPQRKAVAVVQCELSRIFEECLSTVRNKPQQDPRPLLVSLDLWRKTLPEKLHVGSDTSTDVYYLNIQALSYRYESILCRLIRRGLERSNRDPRWTEWVHQRLRSAILELDAIAVRVLANGTFQCFPIFFVTTIMALLALHIEAALDSNESDLVRSMSRISISQTMLVLSQGREIPVLKRALPIFEEVLAKKLRLAVPEPEQTAMQIQLRQDVCEHVTEVEDTRTAAEGDPAPQTYGVNLVSGLSPVLQQQHQFGADIFFDMDSLNFNFLNEWQMN